MAKTITLKFGADGSIIQAESSASNIRQGDSNGEVSVIASFTGKRNDEYVAKFYFERPDGKKQSNILMSPSSSQSSDFVYSIGSAWFFAVAGTAKITVRLTDFDGALSAQGSFSFNVEATQIDVEDSTITYDEAAEIEGLIAQISESAVKRAVQVTLASNANASDFYSACIAYYEGNPKDGDRFTASTTGITSSIVRKYAGQFMGDDKMLIIEKQTASLGPGTSVVSQNAYLVTGSSDNPTVTKIGNQDSIDELFSFFDENGNANSAVADSQGNVIHTTYATDLSVVHNTGAETIAGNKTFSGETRFNGVTYSNHIWPTSGAPKFLGFSDKRWETVYTNDIYLYYGVINYGTYKVRFRQQNGYLAFESYVDDAEAAAKAYTDAEVGKLLGGDYVAKRAKSDEAGNDIQTYYVAHSDVVNSLGSTSTVDPLSAYQGKLLKDAIDAINAILASDDDALDEIREIVAYIKSNRSLIDDITTAKISYTDIVDGLNSQLATKPLSANQGYVLDQKKIDKADIEDSLNSSSATKVLSANQGRILAGQIANVSDAYDAKIEELEEWAGDIDQAEAGRVEAEQGRVEAEEGRVAAEEAREGRIEALESGLAETKELAKIAYFAHGSTLSTVSDTTLAAIKAVPAGAQRFASLDGFKGNSIVWKQLVHALTSDYWQASNSSKASAAFADGVATLTILQTGTQGASNTSIRTKTNFSLIAPAGHKLLIMVDAKSSVSGVSIGYDIANVGGTFSETTSTSWKTFSEIITASTTGWTYICNRSNDLEVGTTIDFRNVRVIDLGTETYTLTSPRVLWSMQYAQAHPEFNAGEILDSLPTKLYSRKAGLNSLKLSEIGAYTFTGNEVWQQRAAGDFYSFIATDQLPSADTINLINTMGLIARTSTYSQSGINISSYQGNLVVYIRDPRVTDQASARTLTSGQTIYYELASPASTISQAVIDGLTIAEYPLTLPALRSAGSVQDTDKKKNVGQDDFGVLYWYKPYTGVGVFYANFTKATVSETGRDMLSANYPQVDYVGINNMRTVYGNQKVTMSNTGGTAVYINDPDLDSVGGGSISALNGKTFYYALANPTDQTGVVIPDLIEVEEGGSLELVCEGTTAEFDVTYLVEAE